MNRLILTLLLWGVFFIISKIVWDLTFKPKQRKKKTALSSLQEQQKRFNEQKLRDAKYKAQSDFYNKFPIMRLTESKRNYWESCINQKCGLLSHNKPTPEELHCQQWIAFLLTITVFLLLGILVGTLYRTSGYIFCAGVFLAPYLANIVLAEYINTDGDDINKVLEKHFLEFYEEYYTQYQVQQPSLELPAMLQGYSETCHPDMLQFVSAFYTDVRNSGPEYAIQMLIPRYKDNDIIRRFVSIAHAVQSQSDGAGTEVSEFLDFLQNEKFLKEEANLQKATNRIDLEINIVITGLLTVLVIVAGIVMLKTIK